MLLKTNAEYSAEKKTDFEVISFQISKTVITTGEGMIKEIKVIVEMKQADG